MEDQTKKRMALVVFVFSILILCILIFILYIRSSREITGKVVEGIKDETATGTTCADSDNGKNYNVKGTVNYCDAAGCSSKEDSCSGKKLIERYCENNEARYEEYECKDECDNGICLEIVEKYKISGSGGGGGGGGSGTSASTTPTPAESTGQTYDLGELTSEHHLEILKNDNIRFTISGSEYILTLTDNTPIEVTINTNSGQSFILSVGDDTEHLSRTDFYIKIKSINIITGKIALILRPVS